MLKGRRVEVINLGVVRSIEGAVAEILICSMSGKNLNADPGLDFIG